MSEEKEYGVYYPINAHMRDCVGIEKASSKEQAIQQYVKSLGQTNTEGFTAEAVNQIQTSGHPFLCTCWFCCPWMYN